MLKTAIRRLRQHFRKQRYRKIEQTMFATHPDGFVMSIGGGPASFFASLYPQQEQIVLIEINEQLAQKAKRDKPKLNVIVADGEALPLANRAMALTICNSVIEHVENPRELAVEIQRTSRSYFLQTPNGRFPLETHAYIGIPFYNQLKWPLLQKTICRLLGANYDYIKSVNYLSPAQLQQFFPKAIHTFEPFLGQKKSFYIYENHRDTA